MLKECIDCGSSFHPFSPAKVKAGGRINQCPDCSTESVVKYLGLTAGDGKQASISILSFDSTADRDKYSEFWKNNSGYHKGKSCQLGDHLSPDPGIRFKTVTQTTATNHKGRL